MYLDEVPIHRRHRVEIAAEVLRRTGGYRGSHHDSITDADTIVSTLDNMPMVIDLRSGVLIDDMMPTAFLPKPAA